MSNQVSADEAANYVRGIMESGRTCRRMPDSLFWGFDEPETMPADSRVLYYYIPTYLNTAFMMQAYRMFPERVGAVPGFAHALRRAMTASAGRGFTGADYSKDDLVRGMLIFANVHTKDFIRTYPKLVPDDFTVKYYAASRMVERAVRSEGDYLARIENTWENNHLEEYRKIVELENGADEKHILFVYGSLMKDRYNHDAYMGRAVYLGRASIREFALYDLGCYPGILHDSADSLVFGELYEVSGEDFERICRLEGNGFLYRCESVAARSEYSLDEVIAETFVYLGSVEEDRRIIESDQPWRAEN